MTDRLKILVLHNCENLASARRSTLDFIYSFERYAKEHLYLYHRIMLPFTPQITSTDWDAVILDSTACGIVTLRPRERFTQIRNRMAFLRASQAVKLAFPQDDASHGAIMDLWFNWLQIDALYTVRPEHVDLIYPITKHRADIVSTLAGYLDDSMIKSASKFSKPRDKRQWVVGQRVTQYPAWGGRFARRKGYVAERMRQECEQRGILSNISTDPSDVLLGDDWTKFLGDCQFVVGAEAGHGLWDPYGTIQDSVNIYTSEHPTASFEEIEDACFLGLDGINIFPGFAPRILEAALAGCAQVLVRGRYRGLIKEGEHYIPLAEDFSNFDEVFSAMSNSDLVNRIIANTKRDLIENRHFHYQTFVSEVIRNILKLKQTKNCSIPQDQPRYSTDTWSEFRLCHFRSLWDSLAITGVEEERLSEPYLTRWIQRELGGQVTDPELRLALNLAESDQNKMDSGFITQETSAEHDTRTAVLTSVVESIRAVNGLADVLVLLMKELKSKKERNEILASYRNELFDFSLSLIRDTDGYADTFLFMAQRYDIDASLLAKLASLSEPARGMILKLALGLLESVEGQTEALLRLVSALQVDHPVYIKLTSLGDVDRTALKKFSLDLLAAANGQPEALEPILATLHADPDKIERLKEILRSQGSSLVPLSLGILTKTEGVAGPLVYLANLIGDDAAQLDCIRSAAQVSRPELLRLSLDILTAIDGAEDALAPIAEACAPDAVTLAAALDILGKENDIQSLRAETVDVFKQHLLNALGLSTRTAHLEDEGGLRADDLYSERPKATAQDVFDLLIARTEAFKDPKGADSLYRVINAALGYRIRGRLIKLLASISLEPVRASVTGRFHVS